MSNILNARGEAALDLLSELIDPVTAIASDPKISDLMRGENAKKTSVAQLAAAIIKTHQAEVIQIFALDDGVSYDEECKRMSVFTIPVRAIRLLSTPALKELLFGAAEIGQSATGSSADSENGRG